MTRIPQGGGGAIAATNMFKSHDVITRHLSRTVHIDPSVCVCVCMCGGYAKIKGCYCMTSVVL